MNYYEKLIQEKNNARDYDDINKVYKEAKRIVDDLRRKYREISSRERDDGNFLYSIIEEKGMPTDSGDQQKAKHAAGLLESVRRMSTTPRDWGNSKGETDMGYYADLIKEKKEKQNFRDPLFTKVVGVGTPDDYKAKFKKGDKVNLKGSNDEGVIVEGPIKMRASLTPTYRIKLADGKVVGRYEEELKKNSKEEKDNEDPQIATLRRKALQKIKEAQKKADWYGDTVMQKFEKDITYAEEEDVPELAGALDRYLPKFEAKVKSFGNSDEEKGYYAKLAEEKASRKH